MGDAQPENLPFPEKRHQRPHSSGHFFVETDGTACVGHSRSSGCARGNKLFPRGPPVRGAFFSPKSQGFAALPPAELRTGPRSYLFNASAWMNKWKNTSKTWQREYDS